MTAALIDDDCAHPRELVEAGRGNLPWLRVGSRTGWTFVAAAAIWVTPP